MVLLSFSINFAPIYMENHWESKRVREMKKRLNEAVKKHDQLSKEIPKHHSNSERWQELVDEYMKVGEEISECQTKLLLLKRTGKEYGLPEMDDDISFE